MNKKLSTDSYKGVRDFYPDSMKIHNYILHIWKTACEQYGYQEYAASILEPSDLYRAKSGSELVEEQTYTFEDRGGRDVTLRPEMTPTLARMVAGKSRELPLPIRLFSTPNLFRYERPQRGRLREHFQLNADILGVESIEAEIEIISLAADIMKAFGIASENFTIKLNDRRTIDTELAKLELDEETEYKVKKLIDKKDKMDNFQEKASELIGKPFVYDPQPEGTLATLIERLQDLGITNVEFDPYLMRGFDYYTGTVFEVFDNHPDNNRSVFGGGRFDKLMDLFGNDSLPAVGFGMGDVIMEDILNTYGVLPKFEDTNTLALCVMDEKSTPFAQKLAQGLRDQGLTVSVDITGRKSDKQLKAAEKKAYPYVICIGEDEVKHEKFTLKDLQQREETSLENIEAIVDFFFGDR